MRDARVVAYVDGLNLYGGLKARFGRKFLWHDPQALIERLLKPGQRLVEVKYFSARFLWPNAAVVDQAAHFEAIEAHCSKTAIVEGRFLAKTGSCTQCGAAWAVYEEKETDVNIALALAEDAAAGHFDTALLVSADSDLCPAVRTAKKFSPKARVVCVFPPMRRSGDLSRTVDAAFVLSANTVRQSVLPNLITASDGTSIKRPDTWR